MRKTLLLLALVCSVFTQAQNEKKKSSKKEDDKKETVVRDKSLTNSLIATQGFSEFVNGGTPNSNTPFTVIAKPKEIEGDKFLYKNWDNSVTLTNDNGKELVLNNANFDTQIGTFALSTPESIYLLDVIRYDKIVFNNRTFLNTYNPINKSRRYLEAIYDSNNIKILKDYVLTRKETESSGGYVEGKIKYQKRSDYYYVSDGDFRKIKLKKSDLLEVFGQKSSQMSSFVKKRKLSFKKEKDMREIFDHYSSL